jgi:uncharacterized protein with PIN domain
MESAQTCAIQLTNLASEISEEEGTIKSSDSHLSFSPPKILIAASKVIEQSQQFPNVQEKIRYLTSVINKLELSPSIPSVDQSPANAHAHALRAQAYLESSCCYDDAIDDARRVVQKYGKAATPASLTLAYRTWADAELDKVRSNKSNDYSRAIVVLQEWFRTQPGFRTKLQQEIQDLTSAMKR